MRVSNNRKRSFADSLESRLESVEEAPVRHYHIRWSGLKLDWEVFKTSEEAEATASELACPDELYAIEPFGDDCPRCKETMRRATGQRESTSHKEASG